MRSATLARQPTRSSVRWVEAPGCSVRSEKGADAAAGARSATLLAAAQAGMRGACLAGLARRRLR